MAFGFCFRFVKFGLQTRLKLDCLGNFRGKRCIPLKRLSSSPTPARFRELQLRTIAPATSSRADLAAKLIAKDRMIAEGKEGVLTGFPTPLAPDSIG